MKNYLTNLLLLALFVFFPVKELLAGEKNLYDFEWLDPDKIVYVLQNKVFEKRNTFFLNVGYGQSISSSFQDAINYQVKTGYFFLEDWGIELIYSSINNSNSKTFDNIDAESKTIPLIRRFTSYYGGMFIFSPFYGKINTFNQIFYYDWNFGIGAVQTIGDNNIPSFLGEEPTNKYYSDNMIGYVAKMALRFYLTELINFNIDLIRVYHNVDSALNPGENLLLDYTDLVFSLGISI